MSTTAHLSERDNDLRWAVIKTRANEVKAVEAFRLFRSAGIEPILIKGLAAAANYPPDQFRDSIDLDLAVAPTEMGRAWEVVLSKEAAGLAIDLHAGLRHLDTAPWTELFERSTEVSLGDGSVRVLSPEDHLRILCVHWLTDGGSNRDRLRDIHYAVERRPATFFWDLLLDEIPSSRKRWIDSAVGMASRTFGTDLSGTPFETSESRIPGWFVRTVEKEWADDVRFRPLHDSLLSWEVFWKQVKKRMPPNPITATVLMNGSIDAKTRIFYQLGTSIKRGGPSAIKTATNLLKKLR